MSSVVDMFTGLIKDVGRILSLVRINEGLLFEIESCLVEEVELMIPCQLMEFAKR